MLAWSLFVFTTASVVSSVTLSPSPHDTYPQLTEILQKGVISKTYPGAVAIVGNPSGILYSTSVGYYSYDDIVTGLGFDMKVDVKKTRYDIASLTKVISTTSAIALLYQSGYLNLDDKIVQYLGKKFSSHQKDQIEIKHCLLHNAGFSPDPVPWYWDEEFACPNTDDLPSPQEDFSCLYPQIYSSLLNESLNSFPGETYVYSDLSFLTLQMVIGKIVLEKNLITRNDYRKECQQWIEDQPFPHHHSQSLEEAEDLLPVDIVCAYEAYVRKEVFQYKYLDLPPASEALVEMESTGYLPPQSLWHLIAPTLNDTGPDSYTHKRLQGQVADGDCYAMGGICGHAGVFSTAYDISLLLYGYLRTATSTVTVTGSLSSKASFFLNSTTISVFTTLHNVSQSSRAYGWTVNTPLAADYGYDNSCGEMSDQTFMHTGYTGTCCCVDPAPATPMWTVILTNRIYNCDGQLCPSGSSDAVKAIYREFNTQAKRIFYPSHSST